MTPLPSQQTVGETSGSIVIKCLLLLNSLKSIFGTICDGNLEWCKFSPGIPPSCDQAVALIHRGPSPVIQIRQ